MRIQNTRCRPSWLCTPAVSESRSYRILVGQVLERCVSHVQMTLRGPEMWSLRLKQVCELGNLSLLP